jgi:hypothetical protein
MRTVTMLSLLVAAVNILSAQIDSSLDYFPLQDGNIWQYKTNVFIPYPQQSYAQYTTVTIGKDTLMPNGKSYRWMNRFGGISESGFYRVDSATACVYKYDYPGVDTLTDSLRTIPGGRWNYYLRCDSVYYGKIFNSIVSIKALIFRVVPYPVYSHYAKGFGLVFYKTSGENQMYPVSDSYDTELIYAKINGREYGAYVSVNDQKDKAPRDFALEQNYPNPFNPSTTIRYQLPERAFTTLKIIDLVGRTIAILVNEDQDAGIHNFKLGASKYNLSSGMYFYQLRSNNFVETKRLTVLK